MAIDANALHNWWSLLGIGLGALVAGAAAALESPRGARANDPNDVVVGQSNSATSTTSITDTTVGHSALWGNETAASGPSVGVRGEASSAAGAGVWGLAPGTGVVGLGGPNSSGFPSVPAAAGVYGRSVVDGGRGGIFAGSASQVRLVPSTRTTHPSSGKRGDLFVDKWGRLWFCKGGTAWHQLS